MSQLVLLQLSQSSLQLAPGESAVVTGTLINEGREVDQFDLSVSDIDPSWVRLDQTFIQLYPEAPGNEASFNIYINIPSDIPSANYAPIIVAFSHNRNAVAVSQNFILVVNPLIFQSPELSLNPETEATRYKVGRFQLNVANPVDQPVRLMLSARAANPKTRWVRLVPPMVEVPPLGAASTTVEVQLRNRNWVGADRRFDFRVGGENLKYVQGSLVQTAALPWLRRLLLTPLVLIPALLLPLLLLGLIIVLLMPGQAKSNPTSNQASTCAPVYPNLIASLQVQATNTDIVVSSPDGTNSRRVSTELAANMPGLFANLLSLSPDGKSLAYVTASDEGMNSAQIFVINLTTGARQQVASVPTGLWPTRPLWSGDSKQLAYVDINNGQLELQALTLFGTDRKPQKVATNLTPDLFYGDAVAGPICGSADGSRWLVAGQQQANKGQQLGQVLGNQQVSNVVNNVASNVVGNASNAVNVNLPIALYVNINPPDVAGLAQTHLAPQQQGDCFVATYSQNDPRWRDQQILNNREGDTKNDKIGSVGCPIAAAAMLLNYNKASIDPASLNSCLAQDANPFDWSTVAAKCGQGHLEQVQTETFSWDSLNQTLKGGQPVIVGLLDQQSRVHYVIVTGGANDLAETYRVNDPWDGSSYKSLSFFLGAGYRLHSLVSYQNNDNLACPDRTADATKYQPTFNLQSPLDGIVYSQPVTVNLDTGIEQVTSSLNQVQSGQSSTVSNTVQTSPAGGGVANGDSISQEGAYVLGLSASNGVSTTARINTHFVLDFTPPQVAINVPTGIFDPAPAADGSPVTHLTSFALVFSATDNLSGIALIEYKLQLNGADVTKDWQPYSSDISAKPVLLRDPGEYTITYRATDGAGLLSAQQIYKFMLLPPGATPVASSTAITSTAGISVTTTPAPGATTPAIGGPSNGVNPGGPGAVTTPPPAVSTPAVPVTPPPATGGASSTVTPTAVLGAGVLNATSPTVLFDPTLDQASLGLSNTTGSPVTWTLLPLSGPAASYLKFSQGGGNVLPHTSMLVPIQLATYNVTGVPITATFSIGYNNGAAILPVTVIISPQPLPNVKVLTGPTGQLTSQIIPIQLQVDPNGPAKPDHVEFNVKYSSGPGVASAEVPISGTTTAANQWRFNWNIAALPPQNGIEFYPKICWSSDSSNCVKVDAAAIKGLSVGKPQAVLSFMPDITTSLASVVTITAQISGTVAVDHISYTYTAKDTDGKPITQTLASRGTLANNYTIGWNTTNLAPQSGIGLTARVCWNALESDATCTNPQNAIPPLNIATPVIIANPLAAADAASLPISLTLSGTISNANRAGQLVFVDFKYLPSITGTVQSTTVQATLITPTNGTAGWSVNFNTATWPPQTATFTPKLCLDGNPAGALCYAVGSALSGTIPDLSATFSSPPADLSKAVILQTNPVPAGRVTTVKLLVTYTDSSGASHPDTVLSTQATAANNFAIPFDSVALGLIGSQTIGFKLQACNATGYCGKVGGSPALSLAIPASGLSGLPNNPTLGGTVPIQATLTGRGVTSLTFQASYFQDPHTAATTVSQTVGAPLANLAVGAAVTVSWDTTKIAPQNNIGLTYTECWGPGELGQGCLTQTAYSNLNVTLPNVGHLYLNGTTGGEYNTGNTLPLPVDLSNPMTVTLPVTVLVSGTNVTSVRWYLQLSPAPNGYVPPLLSQVGLAADGSASTTLALSLGSLQSQGLNFNTTTLTLVANPVWNNSIEYPDPGSAKTLNIKLVTFALQTVVGNYYVPLLPSSNPGALMLGRTTFFNGTIGNNNGLVKRLIFSAGVTNTALSQLMYGQNDVEATPDPASGTWSFTWDHVGQTPKFLPQTGLYLGWRLCNTTGTDYSGCLPVSTTGIVSNVGGLTLGGIQFDPANNPTLPLTNPNAFFSSTFTATILLNAGQATHQVRFYAYPGNVSNPSAYRVQLLTRPDIVVSPDNNTWQMSVYWPDSSTPPAGTVSTATLLSALVNNQLTISAQYCLNASPSLSPDDPNCSDWSGQAMYAVTYGLSPTWQAAVGARLGVVQTWQSYTGNGSDPYNSYIQQGNVTYRTPTVRVLTAPGVTIVGNNASFSYSSTPNISQTFMGTATSISPNFYSYTWNVNGIPFPIDATNARSAQLQSSITFNIPGDNTNYQNLATIQTHGRSSDYVPSTATATPTVVVATVTATPTTVVATATPTLVSTVAVASNPTVAPTSTPVADTPTATPIASTATPTVVIPTATPTMVIPTTTPTVVTPTATLTPVAPTVTFPPTTVAFTTTVAPTPTVIAATPTP